MRTDHQADEDFVLDSRSRRPLPTGLGAPSSDPGDPRSHVTALFDLTLFPTFGLPMTLPADEQAVLALVNS